MRQSPLRGPIAATVLVALAGACTLQSEAAQTREAQAPAEASGTVLAAADPVPNVVPVTTADFFFRAPDTIAAGLTTFRLKNLGPEFHHIQLVRLDRGHTVRDLLDQLATSERLPDWARLVGGPNTPVPGAESEGTVRLEPGDYALVCLIPSPDGVVHAMKGMARPLVVRREGTAAAEPRADLTITLDDYSYALSAPISAGRRTLRVENAARQIHELVLVRLAPGKSPHDLLAWMAKPEGPPPGAPIGGTSMFAPGVVNFVTADFTPGEYALLCFAPDAGDGKPHVEHGMVRQIHVD